ncbi:MAG: G-D-S-L family lipolytic protein, partial [Planctomyces sp.]|nr:G-D-S-L family lipolytic protein [Planctomyces sp.]
RLSAAEQSSSDEVKARRDLLKSADRVLFLGDSITYSGAYVTDVELWMRTQEWLPKVPHVINTGLSSETVSGLSEEDHAGGQFPRPDLATRLDSVLKTTKPDLVFACYGMNCGIYKPLDEKRFEKYQDGIRLLQQKVKATGAELILITPPYYDDQVAKGDFSYNAVLTAYSEWLLTLRGEGQPVIDLHSSMQAAVEDRRKADPAFTFQKDAVHPDTAGHWAIAQAIIRWFGDEESANADSPTALISEAENADEIVALAHQRMAVLRDAYLTAAGHERPRVPQGIAIHDAEKKASELDAQLKDALKK